MCVHPHVCMCVCVVCILWLYNILALFDNPAHFLLLQKSSLQKCFSRSMIVRTYMALVNVRQGFSNITI